MISRWKAEVREARSRTTDSDVIHALESLDREVEFRRETSIGQRVRALARISLKELPADQAATLEREAVAAYDARRALAHTGELTESALNTALEQASRVVRTLLSLRLGIVGN
jgi:hypothetical protein